MTTYSISLDDVDLAFLPMGSHSHNDFLKKEYFHFQVMKTEAVEETMPVILYTCHICAAEVPAAFASEHSASMKHRANVRIANVATERTRALISALPPPFAEQSNAQFCVNCSMIVSKNHDQTKEHRVAVLQDKLLWELMATYVGGDNEEDGNLHSGDISDYSSDNEDLTINSKTDDENKENYEDHNKLKINNGDGEKNKKCDEINMKGVESNGQIDNEVLKIQNDKKYYDNVDSTLENKIIDTETGKNESNNKLRYSIDVCIKIKENMERSARNAQVSTAKTTQGKLEYDDFVPDCKKFVKVSTDHYHTFIGKTGKMECILCKRTFNCEEALSRAFSIRHLIPSIMSDEMHVKKINNIYSYCSICNQMVTNVKVDNHNTTLYHQMNKVRKTVTVTNTMYHNQTIASANGDNKQVSQNVNENVKDQTEDTAEIKIKGTTRISVVKNADSRRFLEVLKKDTPEAGKEVKNTAKSNKVKIAANRKLLEEVFKNNTPEENEKHTAKSSEVKNADNWKLLKEVFETNTSEENVKNTAGSSEVKNDNLTRPVDVFKYNTPKEQSTGTDERSDVENATTWKIIDEAFKNETPKEEVKNTASSESKNAPDEYVMAGFSGFKLSKIAETVIHAFEETDDEKVQRCVICDCNVPNTLENRRNHLAGTRHAKCQRNIKKRHLYEPAKQENRVRCTMCDCNVQDTAKAKKGHFYRFHIYDNAENGQVSYPFEITQPDDMLRCVICDCHVPNNDKNRLEHLLGSSHINKQL